MEVKGSVELAPLTGLVEAIVDLTATGTTLRENGLVIREEIAVCTARLIANPVAHKLKAEPSTPCWSASVRCERLTLAGDPGALAAELRDLVPAGESVSETVARDHRPGPRRGDDALRYYTRKFDTAVAAGRASGPGGGARHGGRAPRRRRPRRARAGDRERPPGRRGRVERRQTVGFDGHQVLLREAPVRRAAVYVPGGRAPYPSTVVMGGSSPASPGVARSSCARRPAPRRDRRRLLGACRLTGASVVYRMGGAQAIAALAYGTETITRST